MTISTTNGDSSQSDEIWYLALRPLLMAQGPGVKPSSIRFRPGQRFALDGDEPIDIESLLRTRSVKIYEESDAEWAAVQLSETLEPIPTRGRIRRTRRGKS